MAEAQPNFGSGGDDEPNGRQDSPPDESSKELFKTPSKDNNKNKKNSNNEAEESCSATAVTSTALTPMTVGSLASSHQDQDLEERRHHLQHQVVLLSVATTTTLAMFILTAIPFTILVAFSMFAASAGLLSYTAFQRLLLEYQDIVATEGFGRYLPQSLVQPLTQTSLHQYMRDDTFMREWGFMALYFVPGLTEDQLNDYIRRLAPDHQELLNRSGMGYFLGDGFMRAIVGERRWRQGHVPAVATVPRSIEQQQQPHANREIVVRSIRGVLDFDSDAESHASTPVGLTIPSSTRDENINNTNTDEAENEERERQLTEEGDVLASALWDGIYSYIDWGTTLATQFAVDSVLAPAGSMITTVGLIGSIGVTVLSMGAGVWQYNRPQQSSSQNSTPTLVLLSTTVVLGSISTGVMWYARSAVRRPGTSSETPPK